MCVAAGSNICLICLLLSSSCWHAKAEDSDDGTTPTLYDNISAKSDHQLENAEQNEELYYMEKDYFLTKLMEKYGDGVEMKYEGFEHLLYQLGLGGAITFNHRIDCHYVENSSEFLQLHLENTHSNGTMPQSSPCINGMDTSDGHTQDEISHEHSHNNHNHTDTEHNHKHKPDDTHEFNHTHNNDEHTGEHEHDTEKHNHEHDDAEYDTKEHNHAHDSEEHNHEHDSEGHNHEHDTDEHNHEHDTDEHNHEHDTEEHNHEHDTDEHNHEHDDDEHNHEHDTEEHNHEHDSDKHNHEHDDAGHNHEHDGAGHNHEHDGAGHNHEHDDAGHNHEHDTEEHNHEHDDAGHNHEHDHDHNRKKRGTGPNQCLSPKVLLQIVQNGDQPRSLTKKMFKDLCPSLIYQIDSDCCHSSHIHSDHLDLSDAQDDHAALAESVVTNLSKVSLKVWVFSTISVIIISLVGLIGVVLIPIMQKVFYNHMLQFLVAMAVGALSGDAMLHLFPHALAGGHGGHNHGEGGHGHDQTPIYKGLLGLCGIIFFFFTERMLTIFTANKRRKKQKKNSKKFDMRAEEMEKVGEKLAHTECDDMMMNIHPNKALRGFAEEAHSEHCTISFENTTTISHKHDPQQISLEGSSVDDDENTSLRPRAHAHGHSHGLDGVTDSVALVAWMVILGDGIHNFCDGLAIGAAFVNSITGGFSTSVAVFCHELPHEIGDFAMLLRAGMAPKQAIIYTLLSSVLCVMGMPVGIAIGNMEGASLWIFTFVGGIFLYIALVDMLPELSSVETKKGEHPLCHLLLQVLGMCLGTGILLVIALYEENLKTMLD